MTDNELLDAIKQLIITLDNITGNGCPGTACEECYHARCELNKSGLFKKLHEELPKLYES